MEDYSIHVRTPNEETYAKVVEVLEPLGVEIVAGETDPLVMALFYLSRINVKLDNLGQLRHLYKIVQAATVMKVAAEAQRVYYEDLNKERRVQQSFKEGLYKHLCEKEETVPTYPRHAIKYLTEDQITALFVME